MAMMQKFSIYKSNKVEEFIRKCLAATFYSNFAQGCSWSGTRESLKISDKQIIQFIQYVTRKIYPTLTENECKQHASVWFRTATTRVKRVEAKLIPTEVAVNFED
ncbi:hypothetical protein RN001_001465 [Aquatica leii]|uniref:Uncharacterized protein n=1 Tax=Aquatica leii TaxID=1421715 RepID=A0AAN7SL91_9COLE|nr:hypothetical protein RN001_001465 [Aquatica leii]